MALADVNGDHELDAILLNSSAVRVFLNDGSGNLTYGTAFGNFSETTHIVVGDVNEDGFQDIVVSDASAGSTVWLGDGSGGFLSSTTFGSAGAVAVGDLNGDGHLDVVLGGFFGAEILLGDGSGGFTPDTTLGSTFDQDIAIGDLNGDGSLDVFLASCCRGSTVWLNDGSGRFRRPAQAPSAAVGVALGNIRCARWTPGDPGLTEDDVVTISASQLLANDSDIDTSDQLTVVAVSDTYDTHGAVTLVGDQVIYDPTAAYQTLAQGDTAIDTFAYTISDGHGGSATATVTMTVNGVNDAPVALDDHFGDGSPDIFLARGGIVPAADQVWLNDGCGSFHLNFGQSFASFSTHDVALGDVDGDGDIDAVVTGYTASYGTFGSYAETRVFLNDGNGTFVDAGITLAGVGGSDVELGDLDGDGHLDLVASGSYTGLQILSGSASGTFTPEISISAPYVGGLHIADFNGDGNADLLLNVFGVYNVVFSGTGSASFDYGSVSISDIIGFGGDASAVGDLNGDGFVDIISNGISYGTFSGYGGVFLNNGCGTFDTTIAIPDGGAPSAEHIALGDVDGDGDLDAMVAGYNSNALWLNDGNGTFTDSGQTFDLPADHYMGGDVKLADVDGDGDLDAIFTGHTDGGYFGTSSVWLNDGYGQFTFAGQSFGYNYAFNAGVANLDGDNVLTESGSIIVTTDQLLANDRDVDNHHTLSVLGIGTTFTEGTASLLNGEIVYDTNGKFETLAADQTAIDTFTYTISDEHGATSVATVSMTVHGENDAPVAHDDHIGAGSVDLVTGEASAFSIIMELPQNLGGHVWINDGNASFSPGATIFTNGDYFTAHASALVDVDGDGDLDLVQTGVLSYGTFGTAATRLLTNTGYGTFVEQDNFFSAGMTLTGVGGSDVQVADFNGDGFNDVVLSGGDTGGSFAVLLNNLPDVIDNGNPFTPYFVTAYSYDSHVRDTAIADVDGDGDLDVVVNSANYGLYVLTNNGGGSFSYDHTLIDADGYALAVGDFNGDGRADIIVENSFGYSVAFAGAAYGSFAETTLWSSGPHGADSLATGDINGDGQLDLVAVMPNGDVYAYLNNGDGFYSPYNGISFDYAGSVSFGSGTYVDDVQLVDVDGDGDLDVLASVYEVGYGYGARVLLNDGNGTFSDTGQFVGEPNGIAVSAGDVDHAGNILYEDGTITVSAASLLANDTDIDNHARVSIVSVGDTTLSQGDVTLAAGEVIYDPNGHFESLSVGQTAIDTFTYTVSDEYGATSVATVSVTVNGENDAPVAHDDILGDHAPVDLVFGNAGPIFSNALESWTNNGAGTFNFDNGLFGSSFAVHDVALGDLDGDGDLDAVITGNIPGSGPFAEYTFTLLNDGTGSFSPGAYLSFTGGRSVQLADMNGDGHLDIVAGGIYNERVLLNGGDGTTFTSGATYVGPAVFSNLHVDDINGDGNLDVVGQIYGFVGSGILRPAGRRLGRVPDLRAVQLRLAAWLHLQRLLRLPSACRLRPGRRQR